MSTIIKSEVIVQHRFTILEDDGKTEYSDAINYTQEGFAKQTPEGLDTAALARFTAVKAAQAKAAADDAAAALVAFGSPMSVEGQREASFASLKATAQALADETLAMNEKIKAL